MVNSVVVVLGASLDTAGSASPTMKRRVKAACLLSQKKAAHLLVSGGVTCPGVLKSEAQVMAALAKEFGLEDKRVLIEDRSCNTLENAAFSKKILDRENFKTVYVVSDCYHLTRAKMAFQAVGVKAEYCASDLAEPLRLNLIFSILREFPALLWYALRILRADHKRLMNLK
ncbi:MAG: YdcF family protein [Methylocystaceae bacterium]|nr:YdcF family protein [Methylocystaceae bacterium]